VSLENPDNSDMTLTQEETVSEAFDSLLASEKTATANLLNNAGATLLDRKRPLIKV
jgi:hypothetical protein